MKTAFLIALTLGGILLLIAAHVSNGWLRYLGGLGMVCLIVGATWLAISSRR